MMGTSNSNQGYGLTCCSRKRVAVGRGFIIQWEREQERRKSLPSSDNAGDVIRRCDWVTRQVDQRVDSGVGDNLIRGSFPILKLGVEVTR